MPEAHPQVVARILEPARSPRLSTPLSVELAPADEGSGIPIGWALDALLRRRGRAYLLVFVPAVLP